MKYAILGDLHSSYEETRQVLAQIHAYPEPLTIIGLGDLFECKIGKKKARSLVKNLSIEEAAIYEKKFCELLTFQTVYGNQEERIALVTGDQRFVNYPETISIEHATIIHGHQFTYDENFHLLTPTFSSKLLFFGHSHYSAIYVGDSRQSIVLNIPYDVSKINKQLLM